MEYFPNFPVSDGVRADDWASAMEAAGWHGICASDHFWVNTNQYPHVFVTATQMASATRTIKLTTSFCNNLFRSPVEFAQAALALQHASRGRFDAGLGAGWAQQEIEAIGWNYPAPAERVSRYVEALQIVKSLFATGQCEFNGEYYQVRIGGEHQLSADGPAPALVGSAGGPRALREVTPLVDRIEIKASARATRGGHLDLATMASVTEAEVLGNVDRVRKLRADVPLGIFILVAIGDSPAVQGLQQVLGSGYLSRFVGDPVTVANNLRALADVGIDRIQLTELAPGSLAQLAPELLATRQPRSAH